MNERIEELYAEAKQSTKKGRMNAPMGVVAEKFAELIVKECAEQIIAKGTDWIDFAPSQTAVRPEYWNMAQQIKQHFGVEE
jgi:hypothetical protein